MFLNVDNSLQPFGEMKGKDMEGLKALMQTADAATLLVKKNDWCGFANYFNGHYALSLVQKSCALGKISSIINALWYNVVDDFNRLLQFWP